MIGMTLWNYTNLTDSASTRLRCIFANPSSADLKGNPNW